jgi:hypothetical protein
MKLQYQIKRYANYLKGMQGKSIEVQRCVLSVTVSISILFPKGFKALCLKSLPSAFQDQQYLHMCIFRV